MTHGDSAFVDGTPIEDSGALSVAVRGKQEAMPTEPQPVTLSEIVHRAVVVADPEDQAGLGEFLIRFEDADEPIDSTAADAVSRRIGNEVARLDPEQDNPAMQIAAAVAVYLAHRRDELDEEPRALLELAARAEFDRHPPEGVRDWLDERGVRL